MLGRFIQPDSIIPGETNPQAWNRYTYALNNPIHYNDPSGHCPVCVGILVGVFFIFNGTSDSYQPNLSTEELQSRKTSVDLGVAIILTAYSIKSPIIDALSNMVGCAVDVSSCAVTMAMPGNATSYSNIADDVSLDPATLAKLDQINRGYKPDNWENMMLEEGSYIWGGQPGQTPYYTAGDTILSAGNDATKIFKGLQASKGEFPTYRGYMTRYEVLENTVVGRSYAEANTPHGLGGYEQFYVPNFKKTLRENYFLFLENR